MNGTELTELIDERWQILDQLLGLGREQTDAIDHGRMTELMRILSKKQSPLNRLTEIAQTLRPIADQDPSTRSWPSESERQRCRRRQSECDEMHLELLAMEAACESSLQENRDSLQSEIHQLNASYQAARRYAPQQSDTTSGGSLDLSE